MGLKLASAILGRPVDLRGGALWDRKTRCLMVEDGDRWGILDPETGELDRGHGPARAIRYALLLAMASEPGNHAAGVLDGGERGEYLGGTALWKPSLRLDPNWAETMRRRSRKEARARIGAMREALPHHERLAMSKGYRWRLGWKLLTLTMPHPSGADTLDQLRLFNAAFRAFTKRKEWAAVWGGCKGVEDRLTPSGPHVHAHFLVLSRYLDREAWREAWRECLDSAAARLGWALEYGPDGLPMLDVRRVVHKRREGATDEASWDECLDEVAKYVTKPADLLEADREGRRIPSWVLFDLCEIARWPRMFELLGKARKAPKPRPAEGGASLDTSCISAVGPDEPKPILWHQGQLFALEDERTTLILGPEVTRQDTGPPMERRRAPSWRELIPLLSLEAWTKCIQERVQRGAAFRLRWLKTHNPTLFLVDLAGNVLANQCPQYNETD